jgi:hypothetical protein
MDDKDKNEMRRCDGSGYLLEREFIRRVNGGTILFKSSLDYTVEHM